MASVLFMRRGMVAATQTAFALGRSSRMVSSSATSTPADGEWETTVGLEIHAQVLSNAKAFSNSAVVFAAPPNTLVTEWDMATPGTLPVLNKRCVDAGILTALALNANLNMTSYFDRKHYFYYDLPSGYQITQQRIPIAEHGRVHVGFGDEEKVVRIQRVHLEHDSGKSIHTAPQFTLVDLNRAGVGLLEIVTQPDLKSGVEAANFVRELILLLKTLGVNDGNLAEGSLRVDANVSVARKGLNPIKGTRCEVKNINGLRFLTKAIEFEAARHIDVLSKGGRLISETRTFDVPTGTTIHMRSKEGEADYRYMPEPDLGPLTLDPWEIEQIKRHMPRLPRELTIEIAETCGLSLHDSGILVEEPGGLEYLRIAIGSEANNKQFSRQVANWILTDLFGFLRANAIKLENSPVPPTQLHKLVKLINQGTFSGRMGKEVFAFMIAGDKRDPDVIAEDKGMKQVTNKDELRATILQVLEPHAKNVQLYKNGKKELLGFFVGQVMRATKGSANPALTQAVLKQILDE